ncbi:putative alpha-N-arabinofuranosidase A [Mollisia scopiformis]|uniref:non-reducing end alpha-L-arabinofuranosidase n=1 Tax=Mollisia scopiformis TaxID=149040 RepID=A0A132B7I5_MOLSC|nr:putative alpha-N-arabinofuranosidase A [Mollisia scopiformis]KUJ08213.1 putative alpha-N-arabinofuranosidase A [Mollisia scopiformis]
MLYLCLLPIVAGIASAINLTVASTGGNVTSEYMYGLMFEDINHSGDGGIYAELIQNRAFQGSTEFPSTLSPWSAIGNATLRLQNTSVPLSSALPTSVNVAAASEKTKGKIGLLNPGWWGIDVKARPYTGSFWALGSYAGTFTVKLQSAITNQVFASLDITSGCQAGMWVEHKFTLEPKMDAPNSNNTFVLEFDAGQGSVNFNLISLFPPTYKNSPNGNRQDLMSALKGLNPSFLRMPGGNNLEGDSYHYRWVWNETIGPLTSRPGRPGTWGYENTDGLGLIEYFNWCADLEMEPLLAVWSGMYLGGDVLSASALAPYVNDTLNELEFLLGPTTTPYGSLRASLGYPTPFPLKFIEIGNEDNLSGGATSYASYRFTMFYEAISAAYPSLTIISSTGDLTAVGPDSATDFHIYTLPDYFVSQFGKWDNVPRTHKVLIGEYANVQYNVLDQPLAGVNWSAPKLMWPVWAGAVSESVWSIGAERNGDVILGQSYAPGFMNLNSFEWSPDLISFTADPAQTVLSTSYYAIQLLSNARYNATVPVSSDADFGPAYWVAGVSDPGQYTFKTAIYNSTSAVPFNIAFDGLAAGAKGTLTVLTAPDGLSSNTLVNGTVVDVVKKIATALTANEEGAFEFELENYSVAVLTT